MHTHDTLKITEETWQEYRQQLYYFILKRVSDPAAAEDITQDVLMRVYTRLETLRSHDKFLPWLYQIARNAIIDSYRRTYPEPELSDALAMPEPDLASAYEQLAPCLQSLIGQLPPDYHEAIHFSEIEGRTQKEVAEMVGISLPGAKSRVQRGRKLLKELLFQCCQFQLDQGGRLLDFQSKSGCDGCQQETDQASCP